MPLKVECAACGKELRVKDELAGKKIRCPDCKEVLTVPKPEGEEEDFLDVDEFAEDAAPLPGPSRKVGLGTPKTVKKEPADQSDGGRKKFLTGALTALLVMAGVGFRFYNKRMRVQARNANANPNVVQPINVPVVKPAPLPPERAGAAMNGSAENLYDLASVPLPTFPSFPKPETGAIVPGTQVKVYAADLASTAQPGDVRPGMRMQLRSYLPSDSREKRPCVLVPPAGSNLLVGMGIDPADYHAEFLPYALAGCAVVHFSLDGDMGVKLDKATDEQFQKGFTQFAAAMAGLVNARNALEYAIQRVPDVDPNRIYVAGHSSAAVLALLFAEHEPRLKGCIAYAPATDTETRLQSVMSNQAIERTFVNIRHFVKQSSPLTHIKDVRCPVYMFHAMDDSNVPFASARQFALDLKNAGKVVVFQSVLNGNHYDSMIQAGMPAAIAWMESIDPAMKSGSPAVARATPPLIKPALPPVATPSPDTPPVTAPSPETPPIAEPSPDLPPVARRSRETPPVAPPPRETPPIARRRGPGSGPDPRTASRDTAPNLRFIDIEFAVESYPGTGDIAEAARTALEGVPGIDQASVQATATEVKFKVDMKDPTTVLTAKRKLRAAGIVVGEMQIAGRKRKAAAPPIREGQRPLTGRIIIAYSIVELTNEGEPAKAIQKALSEVDGIAADSITVNLEAKTITFVIPDAAKVPSSVPEKKLLDAGIKVRLVSATPAT